MQAVRSIHSGFLASVVMDFHESRYPSIMCGCLACLALAKASQGQCKVDQTTQGMGKGKEGDVVLFSCCYPTKSTELFNFFVQVNLKASKKCFCGVHPHAAKYVTTAREMNALDLLSYHHKNELACVNTSQSLHCMPFVASPNEVLPCLTCGTKALFSFIEYVCRKAWPLVLMTTTSYSHAYPHLGRMGNT